MTAFVAEAQRLGIDIPLSVQSMAGLYRPSGKPYTGPNQDAEGLCISGCTYCRDFRNTVRRALEVEADTQAIFDMGYDMGYENGFVDGQADAQQCLVADLRDIANELEAIGA